jgi:2,3-bisphosphoglycerate-dependent phosphoglycerate mutase
MRYMRNKKGALIIPIFLGIVLFAAAGLFAAEKSGATTFILVRHAEKVTDGSPDPPLTSEGSRRASELAYVIHHLPLAAVYSTPFKRTRDTAAPAAAQMGLEIQTYNPDSDEEFLNELITDYAGKSVLIVGHSNTIPMLVNILLGSDRYEQLDDHIYDNLFIVTVSPGGHASAYQMRFGFPTPEKH